MTSSSVHMYIQTVFNTSSIEEFQDLVETCGYKVVKTDNLAIVQWTEGANNLIVPPVKGIIYNVKSGQIMAPGVHIPRSQQPTDPEIKFVGHTVAIDGVMLRAWFDGEKWNWSTNGMIYPENLNGHDFKCLLTEADPPVMTEIFADLKNLLYREYCYFFVLEHQDNPLTVMPYRNSVTLVRVVDKAGKVTADYMHRFKSRVQLMKMSVQDSQDLFELINRESQKKRFFIEPSDFGLVYHYSDGSTYRRLTDNAQEAHDLRPNYPNVRQHWIYYVRGTEDPNAWLAEGSKLFKYVNYFPWHEAEIKGLCRFFQKEVSPEKYRDTCRHVTMLKALTEKYQEIISDISCQAKWTITGNVVTIPHLGDFPDNESAESASEYYTNCPYELF